MIRAGKIVLLVLLGVLALGVSARADVACSSSKVSCGVAVPTAAPTATPQPTPTPQPTFPATGNFSAVTPYFTYTNDGNSGTSLTVDWTAGGSHQKTTITGSATFTFTAPPGPASLTLVLIHEASATSYTLTWPATVKWPSGTKIANTNTTGAVDIVTCFYDGTNYYCVGNVNFS